MNNSIIVIENNNSSSYSLFFKKKIDKYLFIKFGKNFKLFYKYRKYIPIIQN